MDRDKAAKLSPECYTVVRPSNYLDRMFYVLYRSGAQSNVLVSAHYANISPESEGRLSRDAVYRAVGTVVNAYPELALVGVQAPSKNKDKHILQLAALHEIDLDSCIEFIDDKGGKIDAGTIERFHNEWDWIDENLEPGKPWWKVVVIGGREVVFVYHHLVSDGRFGAIFHDKFLDALNRPQDDNQPTSIIKIDSERVKLSKEVEEFWLSKAFAFAAVWEFLVHLFLRCFMGKRLLFHDLPKPKPYSSAITEASPEYRTRTKVTSLRISAARMRRILAACRTQDATFTPLLIVMIIGILSVEFYPDAKVGLSNCGLDMRPVFPSGGNGSGNLIECGGGTKRIAWLQDYRRMFRRTGGSDAASSEAAKTEFDKQTAWELVRKYRASLTSFLSGNNSKALIIYRSGNTLPSDLEDYISAFYPALGMHQRGAVHVSNIGAYSAQESGPWKIDDMNFSVAAINGNLSPSISVSVAGVKGGDTVINATYESDILPDDMASRILAAALENMETLIDS